MEIEMKMVMIDNTVQAKILHSQLTGSCKV